MFISWVRTTVFKSEQHSKINDVNDTRKPNLFFQNISKRGFWTCTLLQLTRLIISYIFKIFLTIFKP